MEEVKEFIEKVDSASPAPGGGAVAAYTSSLAVALTRMAVNISMKRKSFSNYQEEEQNYVRDLMAKLKIIEDKMYELKDKDVETFNEYMVAYRSKDQKEIDRMTLECFKLPKNLNELIIDSLELIFALEKYVVSSVMSDYKMSLLMLSSMFDCCNENMLINLKWIEDKDVQETYKNIREVSLLWINKINDKKKSWEE
jgi:formiminotetrahydrofolate cyclodeaminase